MKRFTALLLISAGALAAQPATALEIINTQQAESAKLQLRIVSGTVYLPATGVWQIAPAATETEGVLTQIQVVAPPSAIEAAYGERYRKIMEEDLTQQGSVPLRALHWELRQYAGDREAITAEDLTPEQHQELRDRINRRPWNDQEVPQTVAPFYFLMPDFRLEFEKASASSGHWRSIVNNDIIAVELHPYLADGKHWILRANGVVERVEINPALAERYEFDVVPVRDNAEVRPSDSSLHAYWIAGLQLTSPANSDGTVTIHLVNSLNGEEVEARWDLSEPQTGSPDIIQKWAASRARGWMQMAMEFETSVLSVWLRQAHELYGTETFGLPRQSRWNDGRTTSVFDVFGGRAAIRETLQMQLLDNPVENGDATIPVSTIPGVEVESHPFEEMLGGRSGGSLPLADYVPIDRFMLHVLQPKAVLPLLEDGGQFAASLGVTATGNSISRNLQQHYLTQLGMDEEWLRTVLQSGSIAEFALILPDLFVVDGTDITVVARIPELGLFKPLLALLGVAGLNTEPVEHHNLDGSISYWAVDGDKLILSTNQHEIRYLLDTGLNPTPETNLGQSAEFRYMLEQLPEQQNTRAYAYFSDPFIRRLVGPAVKIGQLRRMQARAAMEILTAGALLYRLDGHTDTPDTMQLESMGYTPPLSPQYELSIDPDLAVVSGSYGTLQNLATLADFPVAAVTESEAGMYKQYVDDYSRFWRQYFDPIAVRLDDQGGRLSLTTFILPLIDSEIYDGLREVLPDASRSAPLQIPKFTPAPVLTFSLALSEQAWREFLRESGRMLADHAGINPTIFDTLGPSIHFMVQDGDPVLALGSGDLLGAFGGSGIALGGSEMMMIPILLTALTRPAALFIELQKPQLVRDILNAGLLQGLSSSRRDRDVEVEFYRLGNDDKWVLAFDFFGFVKLRFGIQVLDRYLVISNLPWSQHLQIAAIAPAPFNAAGLELLPGNVQEQLPALFAAAAEQQRKAAFRGMAYLYPVTLLYPGDIALALEHHQRLFGFAPAHPAGGEWQWENGRLASTQYGDLQHRRQPAYAPGEADFGLFGRISDLFLNLQFENSGMRTLLEWSLRK